MIHLVSPPYQVLEMSYHSRREASRERLSLRYLSTTLSITSKSIVICSSMSSATRSLPQYRDLCPLLVKVNPPFTQRTENNCCTTLSKSHEAALGHYRAYERVLSGTVA